MTRRRTALISLAAAFLAVTIGILAVPVDAFRAPLAAAASRALGRAVQIRGPLHLSLYPEFGLSLGDVTIADIAGPGTPPMVTVGKLYLGADPGSLLAGRLEITRVVLRRPVVRLSVGGDRSGNRRASAGGGAPGAAAPIAVSIRHVRIVDGTVAYADARTRQTKTLQKVSLSLTMPASAAAQGAVILTGAATYNSVPLAVAARLDDLPAFLAGSAGKASLTLGSTLFDLAFDGKLAAAGSATGNVTLAARSLRDLAAWAGERLPPGNGFGSVKIAGRIAAQNGLYRLADARIALDGMQISGDLAVDVRDAVPALTGTLAVDHLDLAPYLAPGASRDLTAAAAQTTPEAPFALAGLAGVDADLSLTIGRLSLAKFKIDRASLAAVLRGGVLHATLARIAAYGGTGSGTLSVDVRRATPSFQETLAMSGIRTEQLLGGMIGVARIAATGSIRADVNSRGRTEGEIVRNLGGSGSVRFANGTISGVDLGAVARVLKTAAGILSGSVGGSAATRFSTLDADFAIAGGVLRTNNLRMVGPGLGMTGSGTVDLTTHRIEFHLDPKAALAPAGLKLTDIGAPFYVRGTWDKPSYQADPAGLARGVVGSVGGAVGNAVALPGKIISTPGNVFRSLFGNGR